jgi:hypothetical protein
MLGVTTIVGVIPGSTEPVSSLNLQPALEIIMAQLELLDIVGVVVFDAHEKKKRVVHVKLVHVRGH